MDIQPRFICNNLDLLIANWSGFTRLLRIKPELHIFVAYGVFFGVFVLVVGILVGGFGSLIGDGVF
ncbi:hypothetical protein, partial [Mobiluncus mulieris]|uniref:hypothetical protein n=1 Tax=Mobiluncus mulieris TaxID=2052 RepID=UPI001BA5CEC7